MADLGRILYILLINKVFLAMLFSWFVSALTKLSIVLATEKSAKLKAFYRSGGMPSTHTAGIVGLTMGILFSDGVSTLFILSIGMAVIVIHDSMGVRLEATKHAKFLNQLIKRHKFDKHYFDENIGHNLPEVIVGGLIGLIVSFLVFSL